MLAIMRECQSDRSPLDGNQLFTITWKSLSASTLVYSRNSTDDVSDTILLLPVLLERRHADLASPGRDIGVKDLGRKGTCKQARSVRFLID